MPIVYDAQAMLVQFIWESANFASGGGTTTLGFYTDANGAGEADSIVNDFGDAWTTRLRATTDTDVTLATIRWETETLSGDVFKGQAGTAGHTSPSPNTSVLVSYAAAEKGPRNRGRSYWPGLIGEGNIDERGVIAPTIALAIQTAVTLFFADCLAVPDVLSQNIPQTQYPGQATPPNIPWPQVLTQSVQPLVATQRRRLRR